MFAQMCWHAQISTFMFTHIHIYFRYTCLRTLGGSRRWGHWKINIEVPFDLVTIFLEMRVIFVNVSLGSMQYTSTLAAPWKLCKLSKNLKSSQRKLMLQVSRVIYGCQRDLIAHRFVSYFFCDCIKKMFVLCFRR